MQSLRIIIDYWLEISSEENFTKSGFNKKIKITRDLQAFAT